MGDDIIHRDKLFGGRATAEELHRKLAWGNAKCSACKGPPVVRVQIFVLMSDMSSETRMEMEFQISLKKITPVNLPGGRAIRTSCMLACSNCKPALMRQAAHGPSYVIVDIDEGPGPDNAVVAVPNGGSGIIS